MKKELINIKGTKNGIIFIVAPELAGNEAIVALKDKLIEAKDFFKGAYYNINAPHLQPKQIAEIDTICNEHGLIKNPEAHMPEQNTKKVKEELAASIIAEQNTNGDTLLIMRNLRSGQTIKYEGNIVIIGDVNPGAEVYAAGNIVVLGKLRGIAHAGFSGNKDAFILAYRLQPTQLRINEQVSRSPETQNFVDYPEVAKISSEGIYIEKYTRSKN